MLPSLARAAGFHRPASLPGLCLILAITAPASASTSLTSPSKHPAPIKLCYEDVPQRPWTLADGSGLNFVLLKAVAKRSEEQFDYTALPWKRCLAYVASGEMDGVVAAAYSAERSQWGAIAMQANGQERPETRLYSDEFLVYVRKNSNVSWDGKAFHHLKGAVAIQAGYVVAERLREMKVELDQSGKSAEHGLRLLMAGSVEIAVLQSSQAGYLVRTDPRFRDKVEVLPQPFASVPLYLLMSRKTWAREPKRLEKIWQAIALEREADAYKKQEKAALLADQ